MAGSAFPVGVLAAAVLAAEQVSFVPVGSAALWLRGEQIAVGDADVVIEPYAAQRWSPVVEAVCISAPHAPRRGLPRPGELTGGQRNPPHSRCFPVRLLQILQLLGACSVDARWERTGTMKA